MSMARFRATAEATVVLLGSGLMALIYTVPAPVLFQIGQDYGPWIAQGMGNLPSLGIIIGGPASGYLCRRFSTRRVLLTSLVAYSVLGPLAVYLRDPYVLLASRFVLGFTAALAVSATVVVLSARYSDMTRARMLGIQGGIAGFIGLASLLISGQIAAHFTWRIAFWMYLFAAPMFLLGLVGLRRETVVFSKTAAEIGGTLRTLRSHWRLLTAVTLLFCASFSTGLQLSFKLGEHGVLDPGTQSYVILGSSLFNALGSTFYGSIVTKLGEFRVTLLLLTLMAAGALVIGVGLSPGPIALGASLMGFGGGMVGPNLLSKALARVSPVDRGSATGLFYSSIFIGEFLNPLIMQPLRSALGTDAAFLLLGAALGIATLGAAVVLRGSTRRGEATASPPSCPGTTPNGEPSHSALASPPRQGHD